MRSNRTAAAVLAAGLLAAVTPTHADEAHRQLDPHIHGRGNLSMAIDGYRVNGERTAPGMDIGGFEQFPTR